LTIIGLLAKHKIFRVSLNLVLDHNLTFGHTKFFFLEFLPTQVIDQKSPLTTLAFGQPYFIQSFSDFLRVIDHTDFFPFKSLCRKDIPLPLEKKTKKKQTIILLQ
jgi:hypothetical protein